MEGQQLFLWDPACESYRVNFFSLGSQDGVNSERFGHILLWVGLFSITAKVENKLRVVVENPMCFNDIPFCASLSVMLSHAVCLG